MLRKFLLSLVVLFPFTAEASPLTVKDAWAWQQMPGVPNAAVFLTIVNTGDGDDTLLSATTPVAQATEIHTMTVGEDNVMRMRKLPELKIPAQSVVQLAPGGNHLMLMKTDKAAFPTAAGSFPVTLTFAKAGEVAITATVRQRGQ